MQNKIKSKTRLVAIQLLAQHLINNENIDILKNSLKKKTQSDYAFFGSQSN